ncbi:MAG: OmpH family outer membrane protein [Bacteroidota bacterium]
MKNVLKIILVLGIFSMPLFSNAQKAIKLGHINSNDLLKMMPGRDSAQKVLEKHAKELETTLKGMQNELETRYQDFTANQAQMSELIKQTKTKELQDMQARIQDFQDNAQKDYQDKEKKILTPIIDRAKKAIEDVAAENKYTYIFDSGVGSLLYQDASEDILPLVKKKLGLK